MAGSIGREMAGGVGGRIRRGTAGSGVGRGMDSWRDGERVECVAVGGVVAVGVPAASLTVVASWIGGGGGGCLGRGLAADVGGVIE